MKRDNKPDSPPAPELIDTLNDLCRLPLVDPKEMACIVDSHASTQYRRLSRLVDAGLAVRVQHSTTHLRPSSRFFPTPEGVRLAAESQGVTPSQFVRSLPISTQWLRVLVRRMDSLAAIYRLASTFATALEIGGGALDVLHQRHGPFDALLRLPSQQVIGVLKQGPALDRATTTSRLWTVTRSNAEVTPRAILALVHSDSDRRHLRRYLLRLARRGGHNIHNVYMGVASDTAHATTDTPAWRPPHRNAVDSSFKDLAELVKDSPPSPPPSLHSYHRAGIPKTQLSPNGHLTFQLQGAHKHSLDLLLDWPLVTPRHFADLLGISPRRLRQILIDLHRDHSLVTCPLDNQDPARYTLSDTGLEYLAFRDRTGRPGALSRWSVSPDPLTGRWRGTRVRRLASELAHTDAVLTIVAKLSREARDDPQYNLNSLDPSHRSRRHFTFNRRRHTIHPDASGIISYMHTSIPFLLEFERRARHPAKARQRIRPYQAYFGSGYPLQDHGSLPLVLVAFDDVGAETQFLLAAAEAERRSKVAVPFATTCLSTVEQLGVLGDSWRTPHSLDHPSRARLADIRISIWDNQPVALPPNRELATPQAVLPAHR